MNDRATEQLLEQYLAVPTEGEADRWLAQILDEVATPVVRQVVASVVRDSRAVSDAEDIVADTLMDLLRRLRDVRSDVSHPIHDLRRYIVTCAYNRCHERLRERYPARTRLRNQLRYLCSHHPELALWRSGRGELVCGFREWGGRDAVGSERVESVRIAATGDPAAEDRAQIAALLSLLLREAGGPLTLDTLSIAIARLIGVAQQATELPLSEREPAVEPMADTTLESRTSLRRLWDDVRQLSFKQRVALLLNLRDAHGRECLTLLPLTRTATILEIAEAVGMAPERFAELWNELPLSDAAIAELLQVTPRQVIKLRRLARERLRRMTKKSIHRPSRSDRNMRPDLDSFSKGVTIQKGDERHEARR